MMVVVVVLVCACVFAEEKFSVRVWSGKRKFFRGSGSELFIPLQAAAFAGEVRLRKVRLSGCQVNARAPWLNRIHAKVR